MSHQSASTNVVVIGAGPIGLELAVALKQAGIEYLHFDAGQIGSTMQWWAPGTQFFSSPDRIEICGVPLVTPDQTKATREQYLAYLRGVARQFDLNVQTHQRVRKIRTTDDGFELAVLPSTHGVGGSEEHAEVTSSASRDDRHPTRDAPRPPNQSQRLIHAKRIVLAIGNMHHARTLNVPGEHLPHVSHYLDDPHNYFDKRVLIVGGKNSAVEAALRLWRVGADVVMSYRGEQFHPKRVKYWLRPEIEWLIDTGRIEWHPETVPHEIHDDSVVLAHVEGNGEQEYINADFVLLLTGYVQDPDLFEQLGIGITGEERLPEYDPATMQTNVPGVYVAGTAAGGCQTRARLFIENSHVHVDRIMHHMAGTCPSWTQAPEFAALEES